MRPEGDAEFVLKVSGDVRYHVGFGGRGHAQHGRDRLLALLCSHVEMRASCGSAGGSARHSTGW